VDDGSYEIKSEQVGQALVVRLRGRLDRDAGEAIEEAVKAQGGLSVVNLSDVEYISSSGVAALVKLTAQHSIRIASPATCVDDVLSLAGVSRILSIHADEKAALEAAS
jgi:anti-anti-sigma factor